MQMRNTRRRPACHKFSKYSKQKITVNQKNKITNVAKLANGKEINDKQ